MNEMLRNANYVGNSPNTKDIKVTDSYEIDSPDLITTGKGLYALWQQVIAAKNSSDDSLDKIKKIYAFLQASGVDVGDLSPSFDGIVYEAPNDGSSYVRLNQAWSKLAEYVPEVEAANLYFRTLGSWKLYVPPTPSSLNVYTKPEVDNLFVDINDFITNSLLLAEEYEQQSLQGAQNVILIEQKVNAIYENILEQIGKIPNIVYMEEDIKELQDKVAAIIPGFNKRIQIVASTSNWRPPVEGWYKITVQGGGGSGGGASGNDTYFCGGGASGAINEAYMYMNPSQSFNVTIGAGGVGVNGGLNPGGNTAFSNITAVGGQGGQSISSSTSPSEGAFFCMRGGQATANQRGMQAGRPGQITMGIKTTTSAMNVYLGYTGDGGSSLYGSGAPGVEVGPNAVAVNGVNASGYGAGGSGGGIYAAYNNTTSRTVKGGNGSPGCVILEYCDPAVPKA